MSKLTQVDAVALRLMDLDSLYCKDPAKWCKADNPKGHFCTREKYHKGFHIEHYMGTGVAYPIDKAYWGNSDDCT